MAAAQVDFWLTVDSAYSLLSVMRLDDRLGALADTLRVPCCRPPPRGLQLLGVDGQ
jgi:hypothetical protein